MRVLSVWFGSWAVVAFGCGGTAKDPASADGGAGATVAGTADPGAPTAGAAAAGAGSEEALVDCDPRKIVCKRAAPSCAAFEVPRVEGSCYGECVKIDRCACSTPEQCPDPNQFTCWSRAHCGPFVN